MNKEVKKFLAIEFKSKATIIDDKIVEVIAPDGEIFSILSQIGNYSNEEIRHSQLYLVEYVFDKNFSAFLPYHARDLHLKKALPRFHQTCKGLQQFSCFESPSGKFRDNL